jgi:uncharacterized membrane protein
MIREDVFWRRFAVALSILITVSLIANILHENIVPHQITLLLFGSLFAIGVGYSITNPQSSPVRLTQQEEKRFRRRQYLVSFTFSAVLGLTMIVKEVRNSILIWLFLPIIILPVVLIFRERIKHR